MPARKKTILFVTGTRAEWGLLESTILALKESKNIDVQVLVTGMHTQKRFGYTKKYVAKAMNINATVPVKDSDDQLTALSKEIDGISKYCKKNRPDVMLVVGDRDEAYAAATVAIHLGIPIAHVSGGDVSGPTVDHYLRNAITVFADVHLVQTAVSKKNVLALGANPKLVKVVGSAGLTNLKASNLHNRSTLAKKYSLQPSKDWYLISMHPTVLDATPITKQILSVLAALKALPNDSEKIILAPNSDEGSEQFFAAIQKLTKQKGYQLQTHLERLDYLSLMKQSAALIGNTSSGLVEAGYLKVPFVNVGNRQQHRESGPNVLPVHYNAKSITQAIKKAQSPAFIKKLARQASPYKGGNVAEKIVRALQQFCSTL